MCLLSLQTRHVSPRQRVQCSSQVQSDQVWVEAGWEAGGRGRGRRGQAVDEVRDAVLLAIPNGVRSCDAEHGCNLWYPTSWTDSKSIKNPLHIPQRSVLVSLLSFFLVVVFIGGIRTDMCMPVLTAYFPWWLRASWERMGCSWHHWANGLFYPSRCSAIVNCIMPSDPCPYESTSYHSNTVKHQLYCKLLRNREPWKLKPNN